MSVLIFGLLAWGFAILGLVDIKQSQQSPYGTTAMQVAYALFCVFASWLSCAMSLWLVIKTHIQLLTINDITAMQDILPTMSDAALVLIIGNSLLSMILLYRLFITLFPPAKVLRKSV